jgi:hypothetical protein
LDALASSGGVIDANEDNTKVAYPGGTFNSPWYNTYNGRKDYGISDVIVNMLYATSDARVNAYGEPNASGTVVPMPYGLTRDDAVNYTNAHADWSRILNPTYRAGSATSFVLTAASVYLARAEAAAWAGQLKVHQLCTAKVLKCLGNNGAYLIKRSLILSWRMQVFN